MYPVEEQDGFVIRFKPTQEEDDCFDYKVPQERTGEWFLALFKMAGIEPSMVEGEEDTRFTPEEELRLSVVEQVTLYSADNLLNTEEFVGMCNVLARFVEEGIVPTKPNLKRIK
jgi:hypothetical protein